MLGQFMCFFDTFTAIWQWTFVIFVGQFLWKFLTFLGQFLRVILTFLGHFLSENYQNPHKESDFQDIFRQKTQQ